MTAQKIFLLTEKKSLKLYLHPIDHQIPSHINIDNCRKEEEEEKKINVHRGRANKSIKNYLLPSRHYLKRSDPNIKQICSCNNKKM